VALKEYLEQEIEGRKVRGWEAGRKASS